MHEIGNLHNSNYLLPNGISNTKTYFFFFAVPSSASTTENNVKQCK